MLRVEINDPPAWSYLWFREDQNREVALAYGSDSTLVERLKKLRAWIAEESFKSELSFELSREVDRLMWK